MEDLVTKMKEINKKYKRDIEVAHGVADDLLCEALNRLGYTDLVEEWHKIPKWYA